MTKLNLTKFIVFMLIFASSFAVVLLAINHKSANEPKQPIVLNYTDCIAIYGGFCPHWVTIK